KSMVELATARGPADGPLGAFRLGCQARAQGKHDAAAAAYGRAFAQGGSGFALRHEALLGWLDELEQSGDHAGCAREAVAHEADLRGSSVPSDAAITALQAAEHLDGDAKTAARTFAVRVLRGFVDQPPEGATVDDRGDASASLAEALEQGGDAPGARAVRERWLAMLEKAAREAPSLEAAHTFDYQRANALVALGRADDAVRMLEERVKELPTDYEPVARLASACIKAGRYGDALPAIRKAIELSYGPRRLRYLAVEAKIHGAIGDHTAEIGVLEREVTGWSALPPGQASSASLADAQKRLEAAKQAASAKPAAHKKP
ncbi:MAG TPA: tetratricopeptide repeat protein, partial [Byssovorax sp.]